LDNIVSVPEGMYNTNISHYLTFFPQRGFIFTKIPMVTTFLGKLGDQIGLPIDVIGKFFDYEQLLVNGIVTLVPQEGESEFTGDKEYKSGVYGSSGMTFAHNYIDYSIYENLMTIDKYGKDIKNLHNLTNYVTIALPCLKTARIEDLLVLSMKYKDKFENLNHAMTKITNSCKNDNELKNLLIEEIENAVFDIASLYKSKKNELVRRGIFAITGVFFTLIPIGLSQVFKFDPTISSSIIGGT